MFLELVLISDSTMRMKLFRILRVKSVNEIKIKTFVNKRKRRFAIPAFLAISSLFISLNVILRVQSSSYHKLLPRNIDPDDLLHAAANNSEVNMVWEESEYASLEPEIRQILQVTMKMTDVEREEFWDGKIREKKFMTEPPNPDFIFHNKLPKSGSSTMNNILRRLSKKNRFNFAKYPLRFYWGVSKRDLVDKIERDTRKPFLLLKHESYVDFKDYGREQPTYINVIRDPLSWVTSRYYFARFGWERKSGCRGCSLLTEEEKNMSMDECVKRRLPSCVKEERYIKYLCGDSEFCNISDPVRKRQAVEFTKYNILNNFYFVGILERFEDTLNVFESLLPRYFSGATEEWKSADVQTAQNRTKTIHREEVSQATADFLKNNQLKEEIELYNFAMKILERRMELLNIEPVPLL